MNKVGFFRALWFGFGKKLFGHCAVLDYCGGVINQYVLKEALPLLVAKIPCLQQKLLDRVGGVCYYYGHENKTLGLAS